MKFDPRTILILKNFSSINPTLGFQKGKRLRTLSLSKSVLAEAEIETEIDRDFSIYQLSRLLNTINLFEDPEITLNDDHMVISSGDRKVRYMYTSTDIVQPVSPKNIVLPSDTINFQLSLEQFMNVKKAMSSLGLKDFMVVGADGELYLEAADLSCATDDSYTVCIGKTPHTFTAAFNVGDLDVLPLTYDVSISPIGITHFKAEFIEYWITLRKKYSKFDD